MHVAIRFNKAGEEHERALDTLDKRQGMLGLNAHAIPTAHRGMVLS
jgi:hypothetical protein